MISCQHDIVVDANYNVVLDKHNTYYAGEPVKFNISGDVDNLVFYSGEQGKCYEFRNRYEISVDQVTNADLTIKYTPRYGQTGGLKLYVSNSFDGLSGKDEKADSLKVLDVVASDMEGWKEIPFVEETTSDKSALITFSLKEYIDNMTLAFHWNPTATDDNKKQQRTYWISGEMEFSALGVEPVKMTLTDLGPVAVMLNGPQKSAYYDNKIAGNGVIKLKQNAGEIVMQGVGANDKFESNLDGWVFTTPTSLNKVSNDKGESIKNIQNDLHSYEYVYTKPGTYKVTFLGRNENYLSSSEMVKEYTITILSKPEEN